ncbi:hypothetical protein [Haladaptatus sp. NG-WS-4]
MSLTTWKRLEPRTRSEKLNGRRAAVHDPLWLLGRQWQFGEFEGEDAGSPIKVSYSLESDAVTWYQLGDGEPNTYSGAENEVSAPPLEALIEREAVRPEPKSGRVDIRQAAEAGEHFLRLLGHHNVTKQDGSPLQPTDFDGFVLNPTDWSDSELDDEGQRYSMIVSGRVLDGAALFQAFEDDTTSGPKPDVILNEDEAYNKAVEEYCSWYRDLYDEPEAEEISAWDPSRMEYQFAVSTGAGENETVFEADEYASGRVDWYSFSVAANQSLQPGDGEIADEPEPSEPPADDDETEEEPAEPPVEMIPTAATYPGMPKPRYWEFEDGNVNLPAIEMAAEDLSRLIVQEFGLVSGDDWFVVPVPMNVGSLARITTLEVATTFGETYSINSVIEEDAADGDELWNMYMFTDTGSNGKPGLFLPPMLADTLETEPVEEVQFARDEMANVGWAIERFVEGIVGQSHNREEASTPMEGDEVSAVKGSLGENGVKSAYQLMGSVPEYWFPLLPQPESSGAIGEIQFELGRLLHTEPESKAEPGGRILNYPNLVIPEEEVPRAGATVKRTYQLGRWMDGTTRLWSGRTKIPGRGETSSGLQFDAIDEEPSE